MDTDRQLILAMYADFAKLADGADVEEYVKAFYDPDCEYYPVEESDPIRGHEALIRWNGRWFDAWEALEVEVKEVQPVGQKLLSEIQVAGRGGESGLEVRGTFFHVFELRNGRILRMHEHGSRDEALSRL